MVVVAATVAAVAAVVFLAGRRVEATKRGIGWQRDEGEREFIHMTLIACFEETSQPSPSSVGPGAETSHISTRSLNPRLVVMLWLVFI